MIMMLAWIIWVSDEVYVIKFSAEEDKLIKNKNMDK